LIKNSQPFGKNFQKTAGGDFFDSLCMHTVELGDGDRESDLLKTGLDPWHRRHTS